MARRAQEQTNQAQACVKHRLMTSRIVFAWHNQYCSRCAWPSTNKYILMLFPIQKASLDTSVNNTITIVYTNLI